MKLPKLLIISFFIIVSIQTYSQNEKKQVIINKSLSSDDIKTQLNILIVKSPTYKDMHNIRFKNMNKFKANFLDTLKAFDTKYLNAISKIENQSNEISKLKNEIITINDNLSVVTKEKDGINIFGIQTSKQTYNATLWSIIIGLLILTFIFLFKFRSSNKLTKEAKNAFSDIEEEYETHRKKSLEREQVLRRKLQDEINKQRNS